MSGELIEVVARSAMDRKEAGQGLPSPKVFGAKSVEDAEK